MQPFELFQRAQERASVAAGGGAPPDHAIEQTRVDCVVFLDRLPEPPLYRRAEDPVRDEARALLESGEVLLTRCLALSRSENARQRLAPSVAALKAGLEVLCHTRFGRIEAAGQAWERALQLQREAASAHRLWRRSDEDPLPVYDRAQGLSRYDPRPEPMVTVKLVCPLAGCHHIDEHTVPARHATHARVCARCGRGFLAYVAEVREVEVTMAQAARRYLFRVEEPTGTLSRIEFDDASGGDLPVARRDWVAFLYTPQRDLRGVLDLTSRRVLWVQRAGPCFVVTVAFGEGTDELTVFRRFRDEVLLCQAPGRAMVRAYYRVGPSLARMVERRPRVKAWVRRALSGMYRCLMRNGFGT